MTKSAKSFIIPGTKPKVLMIKSSICLKQISLHFYINDYQAGNNYGIGFGATD